MSDETVRLTYAELAKARGITPAAAKRMAMRHRWPKQIGNDGLSRVSVPASALVRDTDDTTNGDIGVDIPRHGGLLVDEATIKRIIDAAVAAGDDARAATVSDALSGIRQIVPVLQEAITSLRVELTAERDRAERAEKRVRELEARRWWHWRR